MHRNNEKGKSSWPLWQFMNITMSRAFSIWDLGKTNYFCKGRKRTCFLLSKWCLSSLQSIYSGRSGRPRGVDTTSLVPCSGRIGMVEKILK